eukprot:12915589-Prorocentrum_lima.AAC.1
MRWRGAQEGTARGQRQTARFTLSASSPARPERNGGKRLWQTINLVTRARKAANKYVSLASACAKCNCS